MTLDGTTIDVCDIHNYLGLPTLSSKVVIRQRFAAACSAIGKLRPMFYSTAPDALKIKLFKSVAEAIAAYALESIRLTPTTSNKTKRPDHLPTLSVAKISELYLLVKSPFWWRSGRCRQCCSDFLLQCAGDIEADHTDSGFAMDCADRNREAPHLGD